MGSRLVAKPDGLRISHPESDRIANKLLSRKT